MFSCLREYILSPSEDLLDVAARLEFAELVGAKACGLAILPRAWTPPFLVVSTELHRRWLGLGAEQQASLLGAVCADLAECCSQAWSANWQKGLVLRSSSVKETMTERGAYESCEVPADFNAESIKSSIEQIYRSFSGGGGDSIAVVVQARVRTVYHGHLSNEKRVSKTMNHWMWEVEHPSNPEGRFNSQRSSPPDETRAINIANTNIKALDGAFKQVGRWCTQLNAGRVHLEWGASDNVLWIFQIDFESDQPDEGHDPTGLFREGDSVASGSPPVGSPFVQADHVKMSGWAKIDKVRTFLEGRASPYPKLYYASGDAIEAALATGRDLSKDIEEITHGRAVCRTDCVAQGISRVNLPRTHTVSSSNACSFIIQTLKGLKSQGANASQVCFIIHKFLPARVAAWAMARPGQQVVLVDSLWGLPDGLQYLNHDTYEYDIKRNDISSENIQYKPTFLQETASGEWRLLRVVRSKTRHRSLSTANLREVAEQTHRIAEKAGKAIQVMWFCDVAEEAGVGRNVPWFMMDAEQGGLPSAGASVAPGLRKKVVRSIEDLERVEEEADGKYVLQLEPEAELFRDEGFLSKVALVSRKKSFPVYLTGSILSHAFYVLERAGVSVVTPAGRRARTRQKQVFRKLVRDSIPAKIKEHGETVSLAHIDKSESRAALVVKLYEESQELLAAQTPGDVLGELADLLEVLRSLASATGTDWGEVEAVATEKRNIRGSFEHNVVLLETSWPAWSRPGDGQGHPLIKLKDLAQVVSSGGKTVFNFASVLVNGVNASAKLSSGVEIGVKIGAQGVEVEELQRVSQKSSNQIDFGF